MRNAASQKKAFISALADFVRDLQGYVAGDDGQWTVKGFIDIYKNVFTVSSDTKIVSKILEVHLFPRLLAFALEQGYSIVLAEKQNWYPDLSFVSKKDSKLKFAVDLKTSYRDPDYPGHVNGFTLGSHGAYFKDRSSKKNIQFSYSEYAAHICLGVIYTRTPPNDIDETRSFSVKELDPATRSAKSRIVPSLCSITSVVRDFEFFVCEKWQLASDKQGSGNTANIGAITWIEDIRSGNGVFSKLGEQWFDEYWMNHGQATLLRDGKPVPIRSLADFMEFKGADNRNIVPVRTKTIGKRGGPA
ncbi:MAG: EcoRV family type II restriction endonuclease [Verrucomicrobiaceae bacterium]|nr:EcoRV family type II restriction endonuclease [Verrucomicrobiaceae bacterium]